MIIAREKRRENIAEYLLYLWQVEDLLRACNMDIDLVDRAVVSRFDVDDETRHQIREWYDGFIEMMKHEHVVARGHMQVCKNVLIRLNDLHRQLLRSDKYPEYGAEYYRTLPLIVELRGKQPEGERHDELETCFDLLYGVLMLKLQDKPVSEGTLQAMRQVSRFIGMLAAFYRKDEEKPLFDNEENEQ